MGEENDLRWANCLRLMKKHWLSWQQLKDISKSTGSSWEASAPLRSLTPLRCLTTHTFLVKTMRQFLTPLIFSITINNRSSLLNLIIGPVRCYLRTRLSFGLTKKYRNKCIKCPSVLLRSARTPCVRIASIPVSRIIKPLSLCFHKCFNKNMSQHPLSYNDNPETWDLF